MSTKIQFDVSCCAYALCQAVLTPHSNAIPTESILPGGTNYEITQIFLDRLQKKLEEQHGVELISERELLDHYYEVQFSSYKPLEETKFPIEILWTAFGVADESQTSPWSRFYNPYQGSLVPFSPQIAKKIHALFQKIHKTPCNKEVQEELSFFLENFFDFLCFITEKPSCIPTYQRGSQSFSKFYGVDNVEDYYIKHQNNQKKVNYHKYFQEIEELCWEKKDIMEKFLSEWNSMTPLQKANARNHDPFVKRFENIFDKIRSLS